MNAITARCPIHGTPLDGGPILYRCRTDDGHQVRAADLDHEFHSPIGAQS